MTKDWTKLVLVFVLGMLCEALITTVNTTYEVVNLHPHGGRTDNGNVPSIIIDNQGVTFAYSEIPQSEESPMYASPFDGPDDFMDDELSIQDLVVSV
jgi:hypothetical protein